MNTKSTTKNNAARCSFCGRNADKVTNMIKGPADHNGKDVFICEICVSNAMQIIKKNTLFSSTKSINKVRSNLTPQAIKNS
ncbi:MAG: hypothetical protein IPH77_06110 [Ignavibacteria bacterium]|nr:hypothetical protein [Ignavibacteria bacterium]